jgi:hypothetical protein
LRRFLAADIEAFAVGKPACHLQQQGGLADAGVSADQHDGATHDAAAQYAVQLADAACGADVFGRTDIRERLHGTRLRIAAKARTAWVGVDDLA